MANTYSPLLRLIRQTIGDNKWTWGNYENTNVTELLEQAIAGVTTVTVAGSTGYTLTSGNGIVDEARSAVIVVTGAITQQVNVVCPSSPKIYYVKNGTSGGYGINFKTASGVGVVIPNGSSNMVFCDGTNIVQGISASSILSAIDGVPIGQVTPALLTGTTVSAGNFTYTGTLTGGTGVVNIGSGQIYKDASGNLGLGVTPKTSTGSYVAFEFGRSGYLAALTSGAGIQLASNTYVAAGSVNRYSTTGAATYYGQSGGIHSWHNAPPVQQMTLSRSLKQ